MHKHSKYISFQSQSLKVMKTIFTIHKLITVATVSVWLHFFVTYVLSTI